MVKNIYSKREIKKIKDLFSKGKLADFELFMLKYGPPGEFKPFAYFDKHTQDIYVRTLNSEVVESDLGITINPNLINLVTVLHEMDNDEKPAGFTIHCADRFHPIFKEYINPETNIVGLDKVISAMSRDYPKELINKLTNTYQHTIRTMQVDYDPSASELEPNF